MDPAVEAFTRGIRDSIEEVAQKIREVPLEHLGHLDHRPEAAPCSPRVPPVEERFGTRGIDMSPEPAELLLDCPGSGRFQPVAADGCKSAALLP